MCIYMYVRTYMYVHVYTYMYIKKVRGLLALKTSPCLHMNTQTTKINMYKNYTYVHTCIYMYV